MGKEQDFEDFLVERNDELDNAAHGLALLMLSANGTPLAEDEFPWNMEIIGDILESTAGILKEKEHHICWPYHGDDNTPCYALDDCKHKCCPFRQQQKEAVTNE